MRCLPMRLSLVTNNIAPKLPPSVLACFLRTVHECGIIKYIVELDLIPRPPVNRAYHAISIGNS